MLRRSRFARACIATTCVLMSSTVGAEAAKVGYGTVPDPPLWSHTRLAPRTNPPYPGTLQIGLVFQGGKDESNTVTVTLGADDAVFSDAAAPVSAGEGCEQVDAQSVRCRYSHPTVPSGYPADAPGMAPGGIQVVAGGGPASSVRITGSRPTAASDATVRVDGGPSGTTITDDSTGPGTTLLVGGPGADVIRAGGGTAAIDGGGGPDELLGGTGKTVITDGDADHPDADVITGGSGTTTLLYRDRRAGVGVDLARETGQGAVGENDTVRQIHRVVAQDLGFFDSSGIHTAVSTLLGTSGNDHLVGSGAPGSRVDGRAGDDVLDGGAVVSGGPGDDHLSGYTVGYGGPGNDVLRLDDANAAFGGPGDDRFVEGPDEEFFTCCGDTLVRCGPGDDVVSGGVLRLHPDCEQTGPFHQPIRIRGGYLVLPSCGHCLRNAFITTGYETWSSPSTRCLTANDRGKVIGTLVPGDPAHGASSTVRVRLPAGYTDLLHRRGSLRLFVVIMQGARPRCRRGSMNPDDYDAYFSGIKLHFRRNGTIR